ncbi:UvrD/REP helicase family protein [Catovirus CTV1]|uniref:DNA 3'-5' helicase n=1 Tax=Catovirus CTV1 TaxID=1977631 RepID=A0A1V0SAC2_9VIRU|nr:UvrD/REP helicase family protein [Catovirus CTV1]
MNNLKELLKDLDIEELYSLPQKEIFNKYKNIGKHVKFVSKMKKQEMIDIIDKLSKYLNQQNNDNFIVNLNEEQIKVVKSPPDNHIRIIACAGSGKTTTIVCRIKYLVDNYVVPEKILLLTFNVESYHNLKKRITEAFGFEPKIEIRTIDSFSAKIYYNYQFDKVKTKYVGEFAIFAEKIMKEHGKIICNNYEYVFFDEFQDVSDIQFNILKHFGDNGCYLTVIGDDNQNIYQWRGTNNMYIINFDNWFKNTNTYTLATNYRSNESIVSLSNNSIILNKNKIEKQMIAINKNRNIPKLLLHESQDVMFKKVMSLLLEIKRNNNYDLEKFAIVSRTNTYLKLFEEYLCKRHPEIEFVSFVTDDNNTKIVSEKNKLTLTTIHKAKGLEWDVVFLVGLSDSSFPSKFNNSNANIEEERRVFYVAVTRAKNYLYFMANLKELSLSRFVFEVIDHIKYENHTSKRKFDQVEKLFSYENYDYVKKVYNIRELAKCMSASDYDKFRKENLLLDDNVKEDIIFSEEYKFDNNIKKNLLETDISNFFNKYIFRKCMKEITDLSAESIIKSENLSEEEMNVYVSENLENIFEECNYDKDCLKNFFSNKEMSSKNKSIVKNIIERIQDSTKNFVRVFTYPTRFVKQLNDSYKKYIMKENDNDSILSDIYTVSLCDKICEGRKRLMYKNVFPFFKEDYNKIKDRLNVFADQLNHRNIIHNLPIGLSIEIEKNPITIKDKIMAIDNDSVIDIRYSESELKIEWLIQMIMSVSILNKKDEAKFNIKKILIINILKGKLYEFSINPKYDYDKVYQYMIELIKRQMQNKDKICDDDNILKVDWLVKNDNNNNNNIKNDIQMNIPRVLNAGNYMFLDTETTGTNVNNADIIQLSYVLYNGEYGLMKKFNKYIKLVRNIITANSFKVHKISNDFLKKKGEDFNIVIREFLIDLGTTTYVIGHNVKFDINVIVSNIEKNGIVCKNIFDNKIIECTGAMSRKYSSENKMLKLDKLYYILFKRQILNAHDASYDVKYTADCYFKMKGIVPDNDMNNLKRNNTIDLSKMFEKIIKKFNENHKYYEEIVKINEKL